MCALLIAPVGSSLVRGTFGNGVTRARRHVMKSLRGYNNIDHMDKSF